MFADFEDAFGNNAMSTGAFPNEIIKNLNNKAPNGTYYHVSEDGTLLLVPKEGCEFKLSGLSPVFTKEAKAVLGTEPNYNDMLEYSYNSQTPIRLRLLDPGYLLINGEKVPISDIALNPNREIKIDNTSFIIYPSKFPPDFSIVISTENGKNNIDLSMKRVPNQSVSTAHFKSDSNSPFYMSYSFDSKDIVKGKPSKVNFDFKISPGRCKTLSELVNLFHVYEALISGTALINKESFEAVKVKEKSDLFNSDILEVLEKAMNIESVLNIRFKTGDIEIDNSTAYIIQKIYRSLINKVPYRNPITEISFNYLENEDDEIIKDLENNEKIAFTFSRIDDFKVFNTDISLHAICGLFNMKFDKISNDENGIRKLIFVTDFKKEGYLSSILFKDELEMNSFYKQHSIEEILDILQNANEIN